MENGVVGGFTILNNRVHSFGNVILWNGYYVFPVMIYNQVTSQWYQYSQCNS